MEFNSICKKIHFAVQSKGFIVRQVLSVCRTHHPCLAGEKGMVSEYEKHGLINHVEAADGYDECDQGHNDENYHCGNQLTGSIRCRKISF